MPVVGVGEPMQDPAVTVWPNPGEDQLHFRSDDGLPGRYELQDASGRIVGEGTYGSGVTTVLTEQLAKGAYMVTNFSRSGLQKTTKWTKR